MIYVMPDIHGCGNMYHEMLRKIQFCDSDHLYILAFRDGAVKTTGTDIDKLLPPMSRFGGGNRAEKKQGVIAKLLGFFERFFGIG